MAPNVVEDAALLHPALCDTSDCVMAWTSQRFQIRGEIADPWPTRPSAVVLDNNERLADPCDERWTWAGQRRFWSEQIDVTDSRRSRHRMWLLDDGRGARLSGGDSTMTWELGKPCAAGRLKNATLVMVTDEDVASDNLFHRLSAMFNAWLAPNLLRRLLHSSPVPVSFHVLRERPDRAPAEWPLGPRSDTSCGYRNVIQSPTRGFLMELAWDLGLRCSRPPTLCTSGSEPNPGLGPRTALQSAACHSAYRGQRSPSEPQRSRVPSAAL
jgi:hypothetical protein